MGSYGHDICDKSVKIGGKQRIVTPDGYVIPLSIVTGLPRLSIRPFTDREWESLPHIIMTAEHDWDPSILDRSFEDTEDYWYDAVQEMEIEHNPAFDASGDYCHRVTVQLSQVLDCPTHDDPLDNLIDACVHDA